MECNLYKAFPLCLLSTLCLYGGQPPQEVYTLAEYAQDEVCVQAPRNEVELCLQLFGLQAACKPKSIKPYVLTGGLVGLGCLAGYYCYTQIKRLTSVLGFAARAAGFSLTGAIVGYLFGLVAQKIEVQKLRTEKTSEYFSPEYMTSLTDNLIHGEQVDVHRFKNTDIVLVGDSLIQELHAVAQDRGCFVCCQDKETGELIAEVPYYGPQALKAYEGREEIIGMPLKAPVSYDRIQELNPCYGRQSLISIVYTHDDRQDWLGCMAHEHPRRICLSSLGRHILRGRIEVGPDNNGTQLLQAMATN